MTGRGEANVEATHAERIAAMEADLARLGRELRLSETRLKAVVDAPMIVFAFDTRLSGSQAAA